MYLLLAKLSELTTYNMEEEKECEICGGSGEVQIDIDDGEGHIMGRVGVEICVCQLKDIFEE